MKLPIGFAFDESKKIETERQSDGNYFAAIYSKGNGNFILLRRRML